MDALEALYLKGDKPPATSSVLTSSSRYLNHPLLRDVYAQMGLKRDGWDLPTAWLIPEVNQAFEELTDMSRVLELLAGEKARNAEFAAFIDDRFISNLSVETLAQYPDETLGGQVRAFIQRTGFDIDFMFKGPPANDFVYLIKREVQGHDIAHMVTGLDPSPVGEIALAACNMVANSRYFSPEFAVERNKHGAFITSTSLMRTALHYPAVLEAMLEGIAIGQRMGAKMEKPLVMVKWEDYFHLTVPEARAALGIEDPPADGVWEWTYEAARG
jgi:ubiquinone biosynthesis protein Coq4